MRFLSPTDQKCVESWVYWQFFYYHQPGKLQYTAGEIVKLWCQELDICLYIYHPLDNRYEFAVSIGNTKKACSYINLSWVKYWKYVNISIIDYCNK